MRRNYYSGRASLTAAGSVQMIASASGARWVWNASVFYGYNCTATSVLSFKEVGNSVSTQICRLIADASGNLAYGFNLGEAGIRASDTNTALKMVLDDAGTVSGVFCYLYDGG